MKATLIISLAVCLWGLASAQTGSVHCGVGCACSELSTPVCGNDQLTYLNECVLRCRKCDYPGLERHYDGNCVDAHFGTDYALHYPHSHLDYLPLAYQHFIPNPILPTHTHTHRVLL